MVPSPDKTKLYAIGMVQADAAIAESKPKPLCHIMTIDETIDDSVSKAAFGT